MPNNRPVSKPSVGAAQGTTKKQPAPKKNPGRRFSSEELSRHEREVRAKRLIIAAMGVVALLVASILGFGLWQEYVARASKPVATVAGHSITIDRYARMLDFRRKGLEQQIQTMQLQLQLGGSDSAALADLFRQQIQQLQFTLFLLPDQVLDQMIDEELVRQEAARRGITVSAQEIDAEIEKNFGDPPAPTAEPAPTAQPSGQATPEPAASPTPAASPSPAPTADVQARLASQLTFYGLQESEFRSMVETQLLYEKLQTAMGEGVESTAEQVHARHILVETEEKAKELADKLKGGASFEELAKAESQDSSNKEKGGDLGWFPRGVMVPEFESVAFQLQPKQISDPVNTSFGWHLIEVLEKEQNRPLEEQLLSQRKAEAISAWLDTARTGPEVGRELTEDDKAWVYKRIKWSPGI